MTGGMARRLLLLAVFAYVVLDLGCPMVPGAFSFDPADSVDAVSAYRARPALVPRVVAVPSSRTVVLLPAESATHVAHARVVVSPAGWRPHAGRDRAVAADPRPSLDDD